jgi:hypothetical protein
MNRFILWAALAFGAGLVARVVDAASSDKQPQMVKTAYVSAASPENNSK